MHYFAPVCNYLRICAFYQEYVHNVFKIVSFSDLLSLVSPVHNIVFTVKKIV